jgi:hypothetical protein
MFVHPTHRYLIAGLTGAVLLAASPTRAGDWDERYVQEAPRIAPYQDRVQRTGDDLHLRLLNGQEVLFTNPAGSCKHPDACPAVYTFDAFVAAAGAYMVEVSYWEGGAFMLVDARTGARTLIVDRPNLDRSGRRFVAVLDSEEQGHAIEIWRLDPAGPQREFAADSPQSYRFVAWHGTDDVELSARDAEGHGGIEIHLVRGQTGWHLGPLNHLSVTGAAGLAAATSRRTPGPLHRLTPPALLACAIA